MSSDVFAARRYAQNLQGAVGQEMFYGYMDFILESQAWVSYVDAINGKTRSFSSMEDFLTHRDGLDIKDLGLFLRCLKAVATAGAEVSKLAAKLLKDLADRGLDTDRLPKVEALKPDLPPSEPGPGRGHKKAGDNVTRFSEADRGNSQTYLLRRMTRDYPDLLSDIGPGKPYRSVRAAAIAAGIVKDVPTVRLTAPQQAAAKVVERAGREWAAQMCAALTELLLEEAQ